VVTRDEVRRRSRLDPAHEPLLECPHVGRYGRIRAAAQGARTGAVIGGTLFSDALSPLGGPAGTYVDMMRHNAGIIAAALQSSHDR